MAGAVFKQLNEGPKITTRTYLGKKKLRSREAKPKSEERRFDRLGTRLGFLAIRF